ncbi:sulfocyanin-like copper-binding protein [Alicyclobacillus sp. ALC3]|uniref:sulfocyanin-like copper-binding protein n=1 Tax=Alicyclobacillus sp. ALC3 TaxID=2796143 RepID=UPI002379780C|nr:sulfocyanin-like copper-binding protein [Alicyclobacillus sp. ALC3]WDL97495.1 hypothetical protein JC200_01835 [Alicyclobacillus sp. ALC3]
MNQFKRLRTTCVARPGWKRAAYGLTTSVAVMALVSGCGIFPSGGSSLGSSGTVNIDANTPPRYVVNDYVTNTRLSTSWLQTNVATKTVTLLVSLNANNLSLNGYSHGFADIDVPVGWHVTVKFTNKNGLVPGSLMVVKPSALVSGKHASAALQGAATALPYQGIGLNQSQSFSFLADKAGTYLLWSAPTAGSGTWMWFRVVANSSSPVVKVKHVTA